MEELNKINQLLLIINQSINDWPNSVENLKDFESQVTSFVGGSSKKEIEQRLNFIDFSEHAWQAESLTQLLELFDFYDDDVSLIEILDKLNGFFEI